MTVNLPMLEATADETVMVSAERRCSFATSSLGGNVDPRQVKSSLKRAELELARWRPEAGRSRSTRQRRCLTETMARPGSFS